MLTIRGNGGSKAPVALMVLLPAFKIEREHMGIGKGGRGRRWKGRGERE